MPEEMTPSMTAGAMGEDQEWRVFDTEKGMEVAQIGNAWYIRYIADRSVVTVLTEAEFEQLRTDGPNPKGLS